jgi:hypothetical protein
VSRSSGPFTVVAFSVPPLASNVAAAPMATLPPFTKPANANVPPFTTSAPTVPLFSTPPESSSSSPLVTVSAPPIVNVRGLAISSVPLAAFSVMVCAASLLSPTLTS